MDGVDELTKEFLTESSESLDRMERCLTELEADPGQRTLLDEIFRAVHTIKGTTGFLGFSRLGGLAHAGENLLSSLRDGQVEASGSVISALLELLDRLRAILLVISQSGGEGEMEGDQDAALIRLLGSMAVREGAEAGTKAAKSRSEGAAERVESVRKPDASRAQAGESSQGAGLQEGTLRVELSVLNRLMDLVGELVLTRNQLLQTQCDSTNFAGLSHRLDCVTADLRETVMRARMQPMSHLFGKFPRMVRDLAQECGKQVRLECEGQETTLDKNLLEAIKDPLTHAVRNAIDHGIELPGERVRAGKPPEGLLRLRSRQQHGWVLIEVEDDGAGISLERVRAKAVERQLCTAEQAGAMSEREVLQMIFLPGFSTSEAVTKVSGRGVGMDVVRLNVAKAGGSVELDSRAGEGTTLRMRVPLTLAIIPALIVRSGGQSFCLPQSALSELVYVPEREWESAVETIGNAELYRLREDLLPLVRLDSLLELPKESARSKPAHYVVVLEADGVRFGLVVDDLLVPEEIVVKPLSPVLRKIGLFSGATMLGTSQLAMILDVAAVAARAGVHRAAENARADRALKPVGSQVQLPVYLVFETLDGAQHAERNAVPLELIERIETVAAGQVEFAGGCALLRQGETLLELHDKAGVLATAEPDEHITVLILAEPAGEAGRGRRHGSVVRRVLDVAEGDLIPQEAAGSGEPLALIKDRLAVVRSGSERREPWACMA